MIRTSANTRIHRSAPHVFGFVVDDFVSNYPRWSPEVKSLKPLTEGPLRPGWRARQVRIDQGRRTTTDFEVITLQPESQVAFRGVKDPYYIEFNIAHIDPQTSELTFTFELGQLGLAFRPFEKLIKHAVQTGVDRVARNLKTLVEAETARHPNST